MAKIEALPLGDSIVTNLLSGRSVYKSLSLVNLVGGFKYMFYFPFHIWNKIILPIDELHHFSRWAHCTTNQFVTIPEGDTSSAAQWPFQEPKLEVPTVYKAYIRPLFQAKFQGISPQNMA